ncbi:unnamed protein product [Blepharisma stoltei]|uniref:Uncharacterized protein n=1 Tax=Blepharisma stoltei TaxID=1481888 RepID=A0AAU9JEV0_9CILI|nr:unnamed protein product [Blepharisma stoltei]
MVLFLVLVIGFNPDRIPSTNPPPNARANLLMDNFPELHMIMVYGGFSDPADTIYGDIWTFDLLTETWDRLVPSDGISPSNT